MNGSGRGRVNPDFLSTLIVSQESHLLSFDCYRSSFEDLGCCQTYTLMTCIYSNFSIVVVLSTRSINRNIAKILTVGISLSPKILVANAS